MLTEFGNAGDWRILFPNWRNQIDRPGSRRVHQAPVPGEPLPVVLHEHDDPGAAARGGALVTFGITPTQPETGYGYIQAVNSLIDGIQEHYPFDWYNYKLFKHIKQLWRSKHVQFLCCICYSIKNNLKKGLERW